MLLCVVFPPSRQVEFGLPELEGRTHIFKIHTRTMSVDKDIRYELIARLCPSSTGAEIRCGETRACLGFMYKE